MTTMSQIWVIPPGTRIARHGAARGVDAARFVSYSSSDVSAKYSSEQPA